MMSISRQEREGEPAPELAAIAAAGCIGEVAPMVVPLFLGAIKTEFGVSEGTAGFVPALEVGSMAVVFCVVAATIVLPTAWGVDRTSPCQVSPSA